MPELQLLFIQCKQEEGREPKSQTNPGFKMRGIYKNYYCKAGATENHNKLAYKLTVKG